MRTSLGLAGDLDDVEMIEDVEAAFGVQFTDHDVRGCRTVGDLYALVESHLQGDGIRCATSMCFYRMRRALEPFVGIDLRPSTEIQQLDRISVRHLCNVIRSECGLRPPVPVISFWGCVALALVPLLPLTAIWVGLPWWIAPTAIVPGIALFQVSPLRLPEDVNTFGDLVRKVSARSIGKLAGEGARLKPAEAWPALKLVLSDHTSLAVDSINRDTLIMGN